MFDDDDDGYNPIEPFSRDEFIVHDDDDVAECDCGCEFDVN